MPDFSPKQIRERIQARYGTVIDLVTLADVQKTNNPVYRRGIGAVLDEVVTARQYLNELYQMARKIEDESTRTDLLAYIANRDWSLRHQETKITGTQIDSLERG